VKISAFPSKHSLPWGEVRILPHRQLGSFRAAAAPDDAIAHLDALHKSATDALREALARYEASGEKPSAEARALFRYPELRVTYKAGGEELPAL
jgi:AMP nucleosidase